jgi:hypothetical protein
MKHNVVVAKHKLQPGFAKSQACFWISSSLPPIQLSKQANRNPMRSSIEKSPGAASQNAQLLYRPLSSGKSLPTTPMM